MSHSKVGVVLWLTDAENKKRLLLGSESTWVSDLKNEPRYLETISAYLDSEILKYFGEPARYTKPLTPAEKFEKLIDHLEKLSTNETSKDKAFETFSRRAKELEDHLNLAEIRFDQIEGNEDETSDYTVHFRHLPGKCSLLNKPTQCGIVKGNKETGESDFDAIKREVMEEVGIDIDETKLETLKTCLSCKVYSYNIGHESDKNTRKSIRKIVETIKARKDNHCGELFELDFKGKQSIDNREPIMNAVSKCAIKEFFKQHATEASATGTSATKASATKRGGRTKSKTHKTRRSTRKTRK